MGQNRNLPWHDNEEYDYLMILQPTSPLRTAEDIDLAIKKAVDTDSDSVMSMVELVDFDYYNGNKRWDRRSLVKGLKGKSMDHVHGVALLEMVGDRELKVEIILNSSGNITINGPIDNKVLFLGLLESAKEAAYVFWSNKEKSSKKPVNGISDFRKFLNVGRR